MAVLDKILNLFAHAPAADEEVVPAPETVYEIHPLTIKQVKEVWQLNQRCFKKGEHYPRQTFAFLLGEPNTLSYRAVTPDGELTGFIFITVTEDGMAHVTTVGTAPEHRRRGIARRLLVYAEQALRMRNISTICLEVRVSNTGAQTLYRELGYATTQRLTKYYNNGEDGYLMVKSLFQ